MSVFGVFLFSIFLHSDKMRRDIQSKCGKIRTRKTPNTDTFHAVTETNNECTHRNMLTRIHTVIIRKLEQEYWLCIFFMEYPFLVMQCFSCSNQVPNFETIETPSHSTWQLYSRMWRFYQNITHSHSLIESLRKITVDE